MCFNPEIPPGYLCHCIPSQWALQPKIPTLPWLLVTLQAFCHYLFTLNICSFANCDGHY